jgi:hypothetical protein
LAIEVDSMNRTSAAFGVIGLPTTLLIDREGREFRRFVGAAEWDAPATIALLKSIVAVSEPAAPPSQ